MSVRSSLIVLAAVIAIAVLLPLRSARAQRIRYPSTPRGHVVDTYFGTRVADPYRWLETVSSPQTEAWIRAQNAFTSSYLQQFPLRDTLRARLTQLYDYPRTSLPTVLPNGRTFYRRNTGLQQQSLLYTRAPSTSSAPAPAVTLLDPNLLSLDGSVALQEWAPSPDGRYVAYALSQGGADWRTVHVRDVHTGDDLADSLQWVRFSGLSWTRDGAGFYYTRYPTPAPGTELTAPLANAAVYYHRVGTPQLQDPVVFWRPELAHYFVGCSVTDDGRYLFCTASAGADNRNRLYVAPLGDPMHPAVTTPVTPIVDEDVAQYSVIDNIGNIAYIVTDDEAPRRRVVALDLRTPDRAHMRTVVPESQYAIESSLMAGGRIVLQYLEDVKSIVRLFAPDGLPLGAIPLPGVGTVSGMSGRNDSDRMFYAFTTPLLPSTVYSYDVATRESHVLEPTKLTFDPAAFETREAFATSKDGTRIPLFITMRTGTKQDGTHPTMLYAYGGFDVSLTPSFAPLIAAWVERGGIYVTANLRGGAEYGEAWHRAGMREVFRGRGIPRSRAVHDAGAARDARRIERRSAGRRREQSAPGSLRGRAAGGRRHGHVALRPVHRRRGVGDGVRLVIRLDDVPGAVQVLAAAEHPRGNVLSCDVRDDGGPRRSRGTGPHVQVRRRATVRAGARKGLPQTRAAPGGDAGKPRLSADRQADRGAGGRADVRVREHALTVAQRVKRNA